MARNILILGGTAEARALSQEVAKRTDVSAVVSLAGRTANPVAHSVPMRAGGFGGVPGLVTWLQEHAVAALIDATHPYAVHMSAHAAQAAALTGVPLLALRRPAWTPVAGDRWTEMADAAQAAAALGDGPRRVFLALGRQEVRHFEAAPGHHFLIRSVDPIEPPLALPNAEYIVGRGPFNELTETTMLAGHRIDTVVAKNSGGTATYAKIAAARTLGIPVLMLRRPVLPLVHQVETVEAVLDWLNHTPAFRGV